MNPIHSYSSKETELEVRTLVPIANLDPLCYSDKPNPLSEAQFSHMWNEKIQKILNYNIAQH